MKRSDKCSPTYHAWAKKAWNQIGVKSSKTTTKTVQINGKCQTKCNKRTPTPLCSLHLKQKFRKALKNKWAWSRKTVAFWWKALKRSVYLRCEIRCKMLTMVTSSLHAWAKQNPSYLKNLTDQLTSLAKIRKNNSKSITLLHHQSM